MMGCNLMRSVLGAMVGIGLLVGNVAIAHFEPIGITQERLNVMGIGELSRLLSNDVEELGKASLTPEIVAAAFAGDPFARQAIAIMKDKEMTAGRWAQTLANEATGLARIHHNMGPYPTPAFYAQFAYVRDLFANTAAIVTYYQFAMAQAYLVPGCTFQRAQVRNEVLTRVDRIEMWKWLLSRKICQNLHNAGPWVAVAGSPIIYPAPQGRPAVPGVFCPDCYYRKTEIYVGAVTNFAQPPATLPAMPYFPTRVDVGVVGGARMIHPTTGATPVLNNTSVVQGGYAAPTGDVQGYQVQAQANPQALQQATAAQAAASGNGQAATPAQPSAPQPTSNQVPGGGTFEF